MIIGFDGSRAFVGEKTGTENYSYQLLKVLLKIDRKNFYRIYINPYRINSEIDIGNFLCQLEQLEIRNFELKAIHWPRLWTQLGLALKTFTNSLDVLFVLAHTLPILRRLGLKTVMTVHDLGVEYLPKHHQLKQQIYLKYITRYQLNSATRLIAVSKATKEDLVKRAGIDPSKISVVYEGYDKDKFKNQKSKIKNDAFINSLKPYYLFVGTVQPRKNLERLIEACRFSLRSNNKLVIVGKKGWLSDDIYKLPKKLGIEKRVKFLGYVSDKDMPALYSGAIALTFPSLFEGFGLPILEAQGCGCPVLTSNVSSMPEVAGKGALYVNPYSVDDIVEGMARIKNEELRIKLIKAGLKNIKRFSWEKCARETLKVLESL